MQKLIFIVSALYGQAFAFPSVCKIIRSPGFESCLDLDITPSTCGFPPRPCVEISYRVPQQFIEVVSHPGETFFADHPGARVQLGTLKSRLPFGAEDDSESYAFHAHTIPVPFSAWAFGSLPCGGTVEELPCFGAISEHLGDLWHTGSGDLFQPSVLAWGLSPKACLLKGAVSSAFGSGGSQHPSPPGCSFDRSMLRLFPPSSAPVCTGWGVHFPRSGVVTSADQTTASLVVASRIKSLGQEVFLSVPNAGLSEVWQMIEPQGSLCFAEGENVAMLRAKNVAEWGRLKNLEQKNYLYTTWKKVSCTKDIPEGPFTQFKIQTIKALCEGVP